MPRYRQDPITHKLVLVTEDSYHRSRSDAPTILPDLPDTISSVDGSIIKGRAGLRRHNSNHKVVDSREFADTWSKAREKRDDFFTGNDNTHKKERKEALLKTIHQMEQNR